MTPPFRRGDMVWSYFPFAETPDIPARTRHAAVVIGAFSATEASRMLGRPVPDYGVAVAVYTSSQVKRFGDNLPIGIIQVPLDRARQNKNNAAFFVDTRVRAYLPIHKDYFPDLDAPNHGLITSVDPGLFRHAFGPIRPSRSSSFEDRRCQRGRSWSNKTIARFRVRVFRRAPE